MQQTTRQMPGPLATPKAFRRPIGSHAILAWLMLADLCGIALWLALGALVLPAVWLLLQLILPILHLSLLLDIGLVLMLAAVAFGLFRQHVQKKSADEAWRRAGPLLILLPVALALLALIKPAWMAIPSPVPAIAPPIHGWPVQLSIIGGDAAAGLALIAHLVLLSRDRRKTEEKLLPYSRAHPGGSLCRMIEQAYAYYERGLNRFAQRPLRRLKTPLAFFFYPRSLSEADAHTHPEREFFWEGGELVICQAYLSPEAEQAEILLPLVARLLHDYNSPVALVERLFRLAHLAEASKWGILVWLPADAALACEQRWQAMERERTLDRDRFAWKCGEGKRLRKLLRRQLVDLQKAGKPDNTIPTLAERIDHLDSLLKPEAQQLKELRTTLPPEPPTPPPPSPPSPPEK
jgi:hypothetical protein